LAPSARERLLAAGAVPGCDVWGRDLAPLSFPSPYAETDAD
jgi:hypothetical protein